MHRVNSGTQLRSCIVLAWQHSRLQEYDSSDWVLERQKLNTNTYTHSHTYADKPKHTYICMSNIHTYICQGTNQNTVGNSTSKNLNFSLYLHNFKSYQQRSQIWSLEREIPRFVSTSRIWNPTRFWPVPWTYACNANKPNLILTLCCKSWDQVGLFKNRTHGRASKFTGLQTTQDWNRKIRCWDLTRETMCRQCVQHNHIGFWCVKSRK